MPDITALVPKKTVRPTPQRMPVRAIVATPPASLAAPSMLVVIPSYTADYDLECRWIRQGNSLPVVGADCLVAFDEAGAGTVVWWADTNRVAMATQAALDAVSATLAAVPRLVSGSVASNGAESSPDFSVVKNGTGDYTVTFTTGYSATPDVIPGTGATGASYIAKLHATTPPSATGFRVACFLASTGALVDGAFTFIARGT